MREKFQRFYHCLAQPLQFRSRILLAVLAIPLALVFSAPLWTLSMQAPQYPEGLHLHIYAHTVAIFGTQQVANFTITSLPAGGSMWIGLFAIGLLSAVVWNFAASWRENPAAERGAAAPVGSR